MFVRNDYNREKQGHLCDTHLREKRVGVDKNKNKQLALIFQNEKLITTSS